jgi:hypothetical protein
MKILKLATTALLPAGLSLLLLLALWPSLARATDDENNEYQLNVNAHARITDQFSTFGDFGYFRQPDDYSKYRFGWPALIYRAKAWLQLSGGLDAYYTENFQSADTLELRPFAGVKLFVPNHAKILLYNHTCYEYRDTENLDTHDWHSYSRIRSRFGVEFPLASRARAWAPKTFYALTDVEPFYRFDRDEWDPVRVRGGLGYVVNDRVRVEVIYTAQFDRSDPGQPLEYNNNIIRLNLRIGFNKGVLGRLLSPED